MAPNTVYVILCSWGGPCFSVYTVCRTKARATAILAAMQGQDRRQWLVVPMELDDR
jgi:hypothetical protein